MTFLKKTHVFFDNLMLFAILASIIDGVKSPHGAIGYALVGAGFALILLSLPEILRFFKFPKNFWAKFFMGSIVTYAYLIVIHLYAQNLLVFTEGSIGRADLLFVVTPKLVILPNGFIVILFMTLILNICSIILEKLAKGKFK